MNSIDIVLYAGFDELDAVGPFEVLVNAGFDTRLVRLDGEGVVVGSHGLSVNAAGAPRDDADLLIVPGGGWNNRAVEGAWGEAERGTLPAFVRARYERGLPVASVCTGGMILLAAGILAGRRATTHAGAQDELRAAGVRCEGERVVDDGDIVTAAGVTSGIDLAFHLVARHRGADVAAAVEREMEWTPRAAA